MAPAVLAITVRLLPRAGDESVPRPACAASACLQPIEIEAAGIDTSLERARRSPRWRHEIDRAAERVRAEAQAVAALIDVDMLVGGRVDFLKIAVAVRRVDRNAVHIELHAAQMEIAREPRAADAKPRVLAPFRLREYAGHVIEHVLDRGGLRVAIQLRRNDSDAA